VQANRRGVVRPVAAVKRFPCVVSDVTGLFPFDVDVMTGTAAQVQLALFVSGFELAPAIDARLHGFHDTIFPMKPIRLLVLFALVAVLAKPIGFFSVADITGSGATVQISTNAVRALTIQFVSPAANSGTTRIACGSGSAGATSSLGFPVPPGAAENLPVVPGEAYVLSSCYAYVANSDKLYVAYVQ
jgi:hypothetical protein